MSRSRTISKFINDRKEDNETPIDCVFFITVPNYCNMSDLLADDSINKIIGIFKKYKIKYDICDTVDGTFILNRNWIYNTEDIPCYIEYCGVYPVNWDVEDTALLEDLDKQGKVIIRVLYKKDSSYVGIA